MAGGPPSCVRNGSRRSVAEMLVVPFGQVLDPVDQPARAMAEAVFTALADRLVGERGAVQHRLDLASQRVGFGGEGADLGEIPPVAGVVAGDRAVGPDQALAAEQTERGVELLVDLGKLDEVLAALADARWQRMRVNPLGEHAAIVDVVVLEAEER